MRMTDVANVLGGAAFLVSVGSLAVSVRLYRSSDRSARSAVESAKAAVDAASEARRARLDNLGPSVHAELMKPLRGLWRAAPVGHPASNFPPGELTAGQEFHSPGDDAVRFLMAAEVMIRNEGTRTASVAFKGVCRVDNVITEILESDASPHAQIPDRQIAPEGVAIAPGKGLRLVVRTGPTLAEWKANGDRRYRVDIVATTTPDAAYATWTLTLGRPVFKPTHYSASTYVAVTSLPPEANLLGFGMQYPIVEP
jgi:hypothetical protein